MEDSRGRACSNLAGRLYVGRKIIPKDKIVGAIVDRRCNKQEYCASDEGAEVCVVPGTIFSGTKTSYENDCCPRKKQANAPGLEFDVVLPDVQGS